VRERKFSTYINSPSGVESTDHETGLPDAASWEVSIENTDDGSKAESVNSKMSGSRSPTKVCYVPANYNYYYYITPICIYL
jgi:hypothetical protein